jgi:hypothetical protein
MKLLTVALNLEGIYSLNKIDQGSSCVEKIIDGLHDIRHWLQQPLQSPADAILGFGAISDLTTDLSN